MSHKHVKKPSVQPQETKPFEAAEPWLTTVELAAKLQVHPEMVRTWSRDLVIPFLCFGRKTRRYRLSEVVKALRDYSERQKVG